ncbi:MAG: hypothetical protein ACLTTU_10960 [Bilophila wadsworthia]
MPPVPPLQPLLFWETGVLLFVAGIVTARFPVPALTACALFAWVDSRTRRPLCCLLAAACVIAGWWIGEKSVPRVPQEYPAWLEKSLSSRRAVTVEGVIVGSRGLPDQRLQIILDDVGPPGNRSPADGLTAGHARVPAPTGATDNRGSENPSGPRFCLASTEQQGCWHRQGVFFQAWAKQDDAAIHPAPAGAELRERLRRVSPPRWIRRKKAASALSFQYGQKRFPAGGPAVPKRLERTAFTPTAGEPPVRS